MGKRPFITFVTRCCDRPKLLSSNIASVQMQTDQDIEQIFIWDESRKGMHAANKSVPANKDRVIGCWIYILDDDCVLTSKTFVATIRRISELHSPELIMVKSKRPPGPPSHQSVVPISKAWDQKKLWHGACNDLCYVMRTRLWKKYIRHFGSKPFGADWWFLKEVLKAKPKMWWHDEIMADARQLGRAKHFEDDRKHGWFPQIMKKHGCKRVGQNDWRLRLWKK